MKVQESRMRWMLTVLALLVCCMVVVGCRSWPLKRAIEATKDRPVAKPVLIWLEGNNIRVSEDPIRIYPEKTVIYWMSSEKISIGYKDPESTSHEAKCSEDDNGITICRSKTFKDTNKRYEVKYYIEIKSPDLKWDPVIEVLP